MKALVFAAGIGSRLKPWTLSHPKALVDVGGKPMLQRVIENIADAGINDIIVNVHHFARQIIDFVAGHDFGVKITISDESDLLLDTGGGLAKAVPLLQGEPVLIHNADILTGLDLKSFMDAHRRDGADVTLLSQQRKTSRYFVFNNRRRLEGWTNVSTGDVRPATLKIKKDMYLAAFDGLHIVEPDAYDRLRHYRPEKTPFSITDFYIDLCDKIDIRSFDMPDHVSWYDVGKPETLAEAVKYIESIQRQ